jgi:hypothetical protein
MSRTEKLTGSSRKKTAPTVALPTAKNTPPQRLEQYHVLLYGVKGIGKTSLAACFPKSLVFQFEEGRFNLPIYQIPGPCNQCRGRGCKDCDHTGREPRLTWERFLGYVDLLVEQRAKRQWDTIVIDSLDMAVEAAERYICQPKGLLSATEARDYGFTWREVREELDTQLTELRLSGYGLLLVSHAKLRDVELKVGGNLTQIMPTVQQTVLDNYVRPKVDVVIYYGYHGRQRILTTTGTEQLLASCGPAGHFRTEDGRPIPAFLAGDSPEEAYKRLLLAWENKLPEKYVIPADQLDFGQRQPDDK